MLGRDGCNRPCCDQVLGVRCQIYRVGCGLSARDTFSPQFPFYVYLLVERGGGACTVRLSSVMCATMEGIPYLGYILFSDWQGSLTGKIDHFFCTILVV